jgi:chromosome segregation ATPase
VAAGFVLAWKKSETFRSIVIKGAQIILNGFAMLVEGIGKFLSMLSKVPGMGWAKGLSDGAQKAADAIRKTSDGLSNLKNIAEETVVNNKVVKVVEDEDPPGPTAEQIATAKKRAEDLKKTLKDVAGVYKTMNKVIADSQEKVADATEKRDEAVAEANKRYKQEILKANKQYNETIAKEDQRLLEATAAAYKRNKEQLESINKDYAKRTLDIEQKLQETIASVRQKAADKSADLMQKAADKQQDIIQKSMNRLRSAFISKTGFSLVDAFGKEGATGEQLLSSLTSQMNASKNLAEKAAFLQANGFSQTFIEQVVSAGPQVGNELADSILNASPETIQALNASFIEMEKVSDHGLDALAKSMNAGANLATEELRTAYAEVAVDLKASLAEVNVEMTKSLSEANENYSKAMTEAKTVRDEKLAEAAKDLMEALAEADKNYKEAVAEAKKTLKEALAEAATTLTEALAEVQKTYNKALDDIAKDTKEKIDALKEKLTELAATLKDLGAKQAAIDTLKNAPKYTPETGLIDKPSVITPDLYSKGGRIDSAGNYNAYNPAMVGMTSGGVTVNQNISYPNASASEISAKTLSAIKFGMAVEP